MDLATAIRSKYVALERLLNERARRLWAATESRNVGYGGDAVVASATGLARATIRAGRAELEGGVVATERQRRRGAGRKPEIDTQPGSTGTNIRPDAKSQRQKWGGSNFGSMSFVVTGTIGWNRD